MKTTRVFTLTRIVALAVIGVLVVGLITVFAISTFVDVPLLQPLAGLGVAGAGFGSALAARSPAIADGDVLPNREGIAR